MGHLLCAWPSALFPLAHLVVGVIITTHFADEEIEIQREEMPEPKYELQLPLSEAYGIFCYRMRCKGVSRYCLYLEQVWW